MTKKATPSPKIDNELRQTARAALTGLLANPNTLVELAHNGVGSSKRMAALCEKAFNIAAEMHQTEKRLS